MADVHWEMRRYVHHLETEYDLSPRVYYSGSRGFSIHLDFEDTEVDSFGAVRAAAKKSRRDADVPEEIADESVLEKNRICRLPYTLNWNHMSKRDLYPMICLPIDPQWSTETFFGEICSPSRCLEVEISREDESFSDLVSSFDRDHEFEEKSLETEAELDPDGALDHLSVLMHLAPQVRDGRHRILHFMLVPALIEAGWEDRGQIHTRCKEWIEETGETYYPTYHDHVENSIDRTLSGPQGSDGIWKPWSITRFLREHPELIEFFDVSEIDGL